jgi:ribonuclease III
MRAFLNALKKHIRAGGTDRDKGLRDIERRLSYRFTRKGLLVEALTHRSTIGDLKAGEERITYERLEFLGDSVLSLVTSDFLFRSFPEENEGQLTKKKSLLVSKGVLAKKAEEIGIKQYIILSDSARKGGVAEQDSVLTAALEAIIGAIYVDGGMERARVFVEEMLLDNIDDFLEHSDHINYKSIIQEWSQSKYRSYPRYLVKSTTGPEHSKIFLVEVKVGGKVVGKGRGKSKKDAEQMAAKEALHTARKHR